MEFRRHWRQPAEDWVKEVDVIVAEYHARRPSLTDLARLEVKETYLRLLKAKGVPEADGGRWLDGKSRPSGPRAAPSVVP